MRYVILFLIVGLASMTSFAAKAGPFARDHCGVVVASRPTMTEARAWISQNYRPQSVLTAHRAGNGWIALVDGEIPSEGAKSRLNLMKRRGDIPQDAFCSTGENFGRGIKIVARGTSAAPAPAVPQPILDPLLAGFDARPFSTAEKRSLQAALAYEGHYLGMLDGKWGGGSQAAIERWSNAEWSSEPFGMHLGLLAITLDQLREAGWRPVSDAGYRIGFLFPRATNGTSGATRSFEAWSGGLEARRSQSSERVLQRLHGQLAGSLGVFGTPYTVRAEDVWVTSVMKTSGATTYLRSDRRYDGQWEHAQFIAAADMGGALALVASSFDYAPVRGIDLPPSGAAAALVRRAQDQIALWLEEDEDAAPSNPSVMERSDRPSVPPAQAPSYSGSGFLVNVAGYAVTNAHVIEECTTIQVNGGTARAVASDTENDLAVLWTGQTSDAFVHISPTGARLNADITVSGFPLLGLLDGLSITRGSVTALTGLMGEDRHFRVSAPVQAGNSGGPVFNGRGEVVGVVVGQLSDRIASSGDINRPQNVNFVIRADRLEDFLTRNGIAFERRPGTPMTNEGLAEHAEAVTVQVTCQ